MNNHPRFWSTETLEHREIVAVAANDYGDIVLTLDGGEVWRFTPHTPTPPPDAKRVKLAGHMRHSVTKALAPNAIIMLRAPEEKIGGNLKIIPAPQPKGATTAAPAPPPEPLTLSAALLLEIAEKCAKELHPRATKQPYHWDVFLAAWKDGQSTRDMERRRKWKRSTCRLRLHEIETELLHGCKIASFKFDDSAFKEVQRSLAAGRKHGAFIRAGALLENEYDREEDY